MMTSRMAAILRDSVIAVVVFVCTRPRGIPLAMIATGQSIHGFPLPFLLLYMGMGLRLSSAIILENFLESTGNCYQPP